MEYDKVRKMALTLPGAAEGTSYGTPAVLVRGTMFVRLREDGETLVLRRGLVDRGYLMDSYPDVFHVTDHYRGWPTVLARLATLTPELLREALEASWRMAAPRRLLAEFDRLVGIDGAPGPPTSPGD
jgi:hypothetical protein